MNTLAGLDIYFISLTIINLSVLIIFSVTVINNSVMGYKQRNFFLVTSIIVSLVCILEVITLMVNDTEIKYRWLNITSNYLGFLLSPLVSFFIGNAILNTKNLKIYFGAWIIYAVWLFISLFIGHGVFYVDELNVYHRDSNFWVYLLLYVAATFFLLVETIRLSLKHQYRNNIILYLIIIFFVVETSIQVFNPEIHVTWTCVVFCCILYYLYGTELLQYIDSPTGLLNYNSFLRNYRKVRNNAYIIVFEIDNFSKVKNHYGRKKSDRILVRTATMVREYYGMYGNCYRLGTDEFATIIKNTDLNFEKLNRNFFIKLMQNMYDLEEMPLISIGFYLFNRKKPLDEVLTEVDKEKFEFQKRRMEYLR